AYFVNYFQKPAYLKAKKYNQNIKVVMSPHSFNLCGYEKNYLYPWISHEQWPWPYIINNPDSPGLYQWADAFFDAGGADYCDILEYHTYVDWRIMNYPNPNEPYHTDPWETLPEVLQALVDVHQEHGIANREIWITEFGANSVTLMDTAPSWQERTRLKAEYLVHYYDVFRRFMSPDSFNLTVAQMYNYRERGIDWLIGEDFGLVGFSPTSSDTSVKYPEQAYMTMREYIKAYDQTDTLLASRHSKATFGPGNKLALVPALGTISKCWVTFPYKQYDPAQKTLVLKGIRVLKMDTLGNTDSVINLTGLPYNKVDQVAIAIAGGRPCIAFTTSDSGNLFYWYRGLANPVQLWSSGAHTGQALFPDIQGLGDTIHLVFYGRYQSSYYIRWLKFRYDQPSSNSKNLNVGAEPAWLSFDLNNQRYPWVVWGRNDSVYLARYNGSDWDETKTVASSYAKWPDIAISGPDTAWIAWHNSYKDSVFVKGYRPYALTRPIYDGSVGPARAEASHPRIDYYSNKAYLLWADSVIVQVGPIGPNPNPYKPWSYNILYAHGRSSFAGASAGDTPLHSIYPSLSVRATDKILSIWTEGEYEIEGVFFKHLIVE
ncbi:MAG: hypothetical protein ABIN54_09715, partial [candidate division WOR-3 bacterium]